MLTVSCFLFPPQWLSPTWLVLGYYFYYRYKTLRPKIQDTAVSNLFVSNLISKIKEMNNQKQVIILYYIYINQTSPERRCSSRTFRYGYLVTT